MYIDELRLYSNDLGAQFRFYSDVCQFPIIDKSDTHFTIQTGETKLTFLASSNALPYHFAFNIPSNKIGEAADWVKRKVGIVPDGQKEIIKFESWNAHAVYFYDPDGNLVEFIARHDLGQKENRSFNPSSSVYSISEIGVVSKEVMKIADQLKEQLLITDYHGCSERFCALGDEQGLFILINPTLKKWFPPMRDAFPASFVAIINVENNKYVVQYQEDVLNIDSNIQ